MESKAVFFVMAQIEKKHLVKPFSLSWPHVKSLQFLFTWRVGGKPEMAPVSEIWW